MLIKSKLPTTLLASLFALALSSCATMIGDSTDEIQIDSEPSGAQVFWKQNLIGTTPVTAKLNRETEAKFLTFKKDGYQTKVIALPRTIATAALWNLIFLPTTSGVTSFGIDGLTGKLFKVSPTSFVIALEKVTAENTAESRLEYVLNSFEQLRSDLAKGDGQSLRGLCRFSSETATNDGCEALVIDLVSKREVLLSVRDGLELYRKL
jgi:hypothetical protein